MNKFSIKSYILSFIAKKRINKINLFTQHPIQTQEEVLRYLIKKAKNTEFGNQHKFNKIKNYSDFSNKIPVRTYEEFSIFIEKIREGKENILWPSKTTLFAKSSGTTNSRSKFIPITRESLKSNHFKAGKDMLSLYENNFNSLSIYKGKGLMLGGSLKKSSKGNYTDGDLSAILLSEFPLWVNHHRIPDIKTALMRDWENKLNLIAKQAIKTNITNITGVPSWMLILLKRILKISGKKDITKVWPNLELYMHGGVNFEPYKNQFKKLIPSKKMNYLEGYNASEGFFAIQDKMNSEGLLLMLDHGIFYEFIDMNKYKKRELDAITLKKVKLNINYALVISTNGGLWRYLVGDVVCFTSLNPFKIKIIGRTQSFLNTFGEELIVDNAERAITKTCKIFNASVNEYTVAPLFIDNEAGKHQWLIEFSKAPKDIDDFKTTLDKKLQDLNSDYAAKRSQNIVLLPPEIISLKHNTFYLWLKKHNRLGGQYKVPRLTNNRKIAEEILALI